MTEITDYIFRGFDLVWLPLAPFWESAFWISLVGALGGAYFGARAAQDLASRKQDKDELTKHIKATNHAVILSSALFELFVGTKRQQVLGMLEKHKHLKDTYDNYMAGLANGSIAPGGQLTLPMDMTALSIVTAPVEVLRTLLVEKLQIRRARPIRLQMAMEQSSEGLTQFMTKRNDWIAHYQAHPIPASHLPAKLLGVRMNGVTDMIYSSTIKGIEDHCNDTVFFSHRLCLDLQEHAKELQDQYRKQFGIPVPGSPTIDYKELIELGLIPPDSEYENWFSGFQDGAVYRNRYQRVWDWIKEVFVPTKV